MKRQALNHYHIYILFEAAEMAQQLTVHTVLAEDQIPAPMPGGSQSPVTPALMGYSTSGFKDKNTYAHIQYITKINFLSGSGGTSL